MVLRHLPGVDRRGFGSGALPKHLISVPGEEQPLLILTTLIDNLILKRLIPRASPGDDGLGGQGQ